MKKIEAVIRPGKLEDIKEALAKINVKGLTVTVVMGCGNQKGMTEYYRGSVVEIQLLQKIKVEIVTTDDKVREVVDVLSSAAKTGEIGDGKIFVYNIDDVIRIRTGQHGESAL